MIADYRHLKAATALPPDPLLRVFERYCARAAAAMDAMEWSWKFSGWEGIGNRVFWLGSSRRFDVTRRAVHWLASELGLPRDDDDREWLDLLEHDTDRCLVSYAGPNRFTGRASVIKVYLTLSRCTASMYRRLVRPAAPQLPEQACTAATTLLCRTIEASGPCSARVYLLFHDHQARTAAVARVLRRLLGTHGAAAVAGYPRIGVGIKADGTHMVGIGLRPTGRRALDPSFATSPVMMPLVNAAVRMPLLAERLNDVTWVTLPIDARSLQFPRRVSEMNVYVQLRDRRRHAPA